ncbi:germ cell nuclear acidic protein-like isoform X1 [Ptychodera flava]|uniref:germ cell nuclear acidic protein-like isoform X1 n=1 Tax=Ptychodera flava TaxID=63121 RepID=UPI00396A2A6E
MFLLDVRDVKGAWNKLESSVYEGYLDRKILAEERTYGILYYEVLLPLLAKCKGAKSPLEMNKHYAYTIQKLHHWSENADGLFSGTETLYEESVNPKLDSYIMKVRESHETDDLVKDLLKVCCKAGMEKLQQHAKEHLPGGEFWEPSDAQVAAAQRVTGATNDECESDFGQLSQQYHIAPSSNPLTLSSMVRAKRDHASTWLLSQATDVQNKTISVCVKEMKYLQKKVGTKDCQLKKIHDEKEVFNSAKRQRITESLARKTAIRNTNVRKLRSGKLVTKTSRIDKLNNKETSEQIQLWVTIKDMHCNGNFTALTGRSKIQDKRSILRKLIADNREISCNLQLIISEGNTDANDVPSSSDDDMDTPLAMHVPLATLCQTSDNNNGTSVCDNDVDDDTDDDMHVPLNSLCRVKANASDKKNHNDADIIVDDDDNDDTDDDMHVPLDMLCKVNANMSNKNTHDDDNDDTDDDMHVPLEMLCKVNANMSNKNTHDDDNDDTDDMHVPLNMLCKVNANMSNKNTHDNDDVDNDDTDDLPLSRLF